MRAAIPFLALAVAAQAAEIRTNDPTARYAGMMEQSPFALATVVEAPQEPKESFAANWELVGLADLKDPNGVTKTFVSIRSRDRRVSFTLIGDEVSKDEDSMGVSVQSVDWQEGSRKSTVMLKKGNETAKVEFGQDTAPQAPPAAPVAGVRPGMPKPGQPIPGVIPGAPAPGVIRPPGAVQRPPVPGNNNLVIPNKPTGAAYPQAPGVVNPAMPASADPRRRVRVINSHP